MKTRIVFSIVSFLFFSAIASSDVIKNEGPVGQIRSLEGSGLIKHANGKITPMSVNELIYADDEVTVNGASRAFIVMRDNTSLNVGEKATLKVDKFVYEHKDWSKYSSEPWIPMKGVLRFVGGKVASKKSTEAPKVAVYAGIRG